MHQEAEKSLRQKVNAALLECSVNEAGNPEFPDDSYAWKASEQAEKAKSKWISAGDAYGIILRHTYGSLSGKKITKGVRFKLSEVLDSDEIRKLEEDIINFFKSIPRSYSLYLRLGRDTFTPPQAVTKISDKISLVVVQDNDPLLELKVTLRFEGEKPAFKAGNILLRIQITGHARDSYNDDSALSDAYSLLKQVCYIGLQTEIFQESSNNIWRLMSKNIECYLYLVDEIESPNKCTAIRAPSYAEKLLDGLRVNKDSFSLLSSNSKIVKNIGFICDQAIESSPLGYLKTAAEWAFESGANPDRTNSFIQLCVALEAILGEDSKPEVGLTEQLSDRCAFYIGSDMQSRQRIRDNFRDLYKHRSKLVHGKKAKLSGDDYASYDWGKKILDYIFMKELRNIKGSGQ